MKVTALKLHDACFPYEDAALATEGTWDYEDFFTPERRDWVDKWISFDCLLADDQRDVGGRAGDVAGYDGPAGAGTEGWVVGGHE